ncbi:HAD superfamily hydrolase (TIGR01509 family)/HAD superfamily hydrolase (TIGR01549 family) [Pseudomonas duriflava]|uniref:HAD superfamily hydrolase (TIGR01509 family)/HAD superfamily hydrolase (TIGR01549 family) n=1 Tax=Pseudomonas duriflava TaxID=459528 RepID=A0A562QP70_9PSED|nr:HAD family hydrolase [Pseudomonas duriflava]TWI58561.1 HAD superfamily hydrolase (TIGR01509 family)/HAD superfamily hydrolase (TIGR01549 family) [Pseudomonas duriflava]
MKLNDYTHWVFDMDGTLTIAVHDFAAIRRALEIPATSDILHHLASLPEAERQAKHAWLLEHERELAVGAQPAPGAVELIERLRRQGCMLGILTRNAQELAYITLEAVGLGDCFDRSDVLGRDEAPPKPHPGGLRHFSDCWRVEPWEMVMVGDHRMDLECGRAAGTRTILVNSPTNSWPELADWHVQDCFALACLLD